MLSPKTRTHAKTMRDHKRTLSGGLLRRRGISESTLASRGAPACNHRSACHDPPPTAGRIIEAGARLPCHIKRGALLNCPERGARREITWGWRIAETPDSDGTDWPRAFCGTPVLATLTRRAV